MNKQITPRVRKALLAAVEGHDLNRKAAMELYAVQERARATEVAHLELNRKAIELWKKDMQPSGCLYGHVLLPDGRMACIQDGSITVWELTKL